MIRSSIVFVCIFLISTTVFADPTASLPDIHVGDVWEYQISDEFTKEVSRSPIRKIVSITDDEIVAQVSWKGKPQASRILFFFTKEMNFKDNGTQKYEPYFPEFKFPLNVGDSWSKDYTNIYTNGDATKSFLKAKVAAYEKVQTPAGEFEAYRIECKIDTIGLGENARTFYDTHIVWYAPKVNGFIKREVISSWEGRIRRKELTELMAYRPIKSDSQ